MGLSPAQFLLQQVITGRAAGGAAIPAPEAISLSSQEVAEDAANGTLIGALLTAGGTAPYVYTLESDPDSLLAIDSDRLEVGDSFASVESYGFTVRTTDVNSQTFDQEFTLTVVPVIENGSGIGEDDGEIVVPDPEDPETDQGGYEEPPVQQNTNDGLKINGKNSGSATFLKDWGAPVPGAVYTMRYTADWSLMGRLGREAAVGFAFKSGNSFHLASLRGDGQVSATMLKSKVYGDFRKANQFTITNDGAAAHGTKDGPNWLRIAISQDGETYTLSTSSNGSAWTEAYVGAFPVPLDAADDATQFGPAGYFSTQDKGVFAIVIEEFDEVLLPENTVLPAISGTASPGQTLTCSTGTWLNGVDSYAYQWLADDVEIDGETTNELLLTDDELGAVITCSVTATNGAGAASATSGGVGPVVATDPHFANVVLLVGFDGTDGATTATDDSNAGHSLTFVGNAQLDTAQSKFGGASLLCDGTGDWVSSPDSNDWDFDAGQFTVEFWVRFNSLATSYSLIEQYATTGEQRCWSINKNGTSFVFNYASAGTSASSLTFEAQANLSTGVWYHFAIDRDASNVIRCYINGVRKADITSAINFFNSSDDLTIGGNQFGSLNGWIDEVRITKGVARYASNSGYTVPTAAFPRS